jgi:hypothetical protein
MSLEIERDRQRDRERGCRIQTSGGAVGRIGEASRHHVAVPESSPPEVLWDKNGWAHEIVWRRVACRKISSSSKREEQQEERLGWRVEDHRSCGGQWNRIESAGGGREGEGFRKINEKTEAAATNLFHMWDKSLPG